jgi:hypothetical protein
MIKTKKIYKIVSILFYIVLNINYLFALDLNNIQNKVKLDNINTKIYNVTKDNAYINIPNLKIGQSGIITHIYNNNKTIILSYAKVIESNKLKSKIQFINFRKLYNRNLPSTTLKPFNNNQLILNYLYKRSILITPTKQSYIKIKREFNKNIFLNSNIIAADLIILDDEFPNKKYLQEFSNKNEIGTIFIVLNKNLYILDSLTFKILYKLKLDYKLEDIIIPFYNKIGEKNNIEDQNYKDMYDKYYEKLLGI